MAAVVIGAAAVVNAGTAAVFCYDKYQALNKGWRVPEKVLWSTALIGGWPAGLVTMQAIHHKNKKKEFNIPYYALSAANAGLLVVAWRNPAVRQNITQALKNIKLKK